MKLKRAGSIQTYYPQWEDKNADGVVDAAGGFPGVRVLSEFSDPKILIATSSMRELYNSADEYVAGSISVNTQELEIFGGTASAKGWTLIGFILPFPATRVYVKTWACCVNAPNTNIFMCNEGAIDAPDKYEKSYRLCLDAYNNQLSLQKGVGGSYTVLGSVSGVDYNTFYKLEMYFSGDGSGNNTIKIWRDDVLEIDVSDSETNIPTINDIRFAVRDDSDTEARSGKFKGYTVIVYE